MQVHASFKKYKTKKTQTKRYFIFSIIYHRFKKNHHTKISYLDSQDNKHNN